MVEWNAAWHLGIDGCKQKSELLDPGKQQVCCCKNIASSLEPAILLNARDHQLFAERIRVLGSVSN